VEQAAFWPAEGRGPYFTFEPTGFVLIRGTTMDYTTELVARAIHEVEQGAGPWHGEPRDRKEQFREYARNAINLLGEDIGVLLFALKEATNERHAGDPRAAA